MARRNISLPQELNDKLDQPHLNASGLIQDLLRAYFAYGGAEEAAEYAAEKRSQTLGSRRIEAARALQTVLDNPSGTLDPMNDAVMRQASKLEVPPEAVISMTEHYAEHGDLDGWEL